MAATTMPTISLHAERKNGVEAAVRKRMPTTTRRPITQKKSWMGLPIFTTEHSPQNVAVYAFLLGASSGWAVGFRWANCISLATAAYFFFASVGMILEYITRAILKQEQGLRSFLIGGACGENVFLFAGPLEYALRWWILPDYANFSVVSSVGVLLAILAQNVRTFHLLQLSMDPRDRSISMVIDESAVRRAKYALFAWRLSLQLIMCNPLCLIGQYFLRETSAPGLRREMPDVGLGPLGLPIFDGQHTPQNISAHAYLLGCVHGVGMVIGFFRTNMRALGFFVGMLALFHVLEYLSTAMYRPDVKMSSFLLNHSPAYHLAMAGGIIEYLIWYWIYPPMKAFHWWNWLALLGVICSQALRTSAMITAGSNFTHIIAEEKEVSHTLVTHGVYSRLRHPSYTAFYWWGVFTQILASNPICTVAFSIALRRFFGDRIPYEEMTLVNFFGSRYEEYRKRTRIWIPFL